MNKPNKNPLHYFKAQAGEGLLMLDIMDVIGADFFGDGITAQNVSDAMSQGDYNGIALNINSPGGDLFQGVAIYNLLKNCGKPVTVNVVGLCASAASLIACAGDKVTMQLGTQYMLHRAMGMAAGFSDDMHKMGDTLDSVTDSAADLYVAKTGMAKDKILAMMKAETWMKPDQAKANGFADEISQTKAKVSNSFDLSMFKNAPIELQAKTKRVANEDLTAACFIYVGDPDKTDTWSLPWHFSTEEKTQSHLRDALSRFDQDKVIPEAHRAECWAKLVRLCKEHGIEVSEDKPKNETEEFNDIDLLRKRLELNKRK